jgi:hypothetical protein
VSQNAVRARISLLALLAAPLGSWAADHQICYQIPPQPYSNNQTAIIARFLCRTDGATPAGCAIAAVQAAPGQAPVASFTDLNKTPTSDEAEAVLSTGGTFTGTVKFTDGTVRNCTVEIPIPYTLKPVLGTQNRLVQGFTTDVSGLVTTGVWMATSPPSDPAFQEVVVPPDFVAVGGGVVGAEVPNGVMVTSSQHDHGNLAAYGPQLWSAGVHSNVPAQIGSATTYAIGLKIQGIPRATLQQMVAFPLNQTSPPGVAHPTLTLMTSATYPQGYIAISGGVQANQGASPLGQYVTTSEPVTSQQCYANNTCEQVVTGWTVASKDHINPSPWWIIGSLTTLPKVWTIGGAPWHIETWVSNASSAVLPHPSATVSLPPDFALTSVGAFVNWQTSPTAAGNLLWDLKPRPDIDGAEAASKDESIPSPASLGVFAVGMKLVPGPVPPPAPINVNRLPIKVVPQPQLPPR